MHLSVAVQQNPKSLDVTPASMQLTVVFEHWHLGDGNYPAFTVGDEARLSLELSVTSVDLPEATAPDEIRQVQDAEYVVVGQIIRVYEDDVASALVIVESGWLRFYCKSSEVAQLTVGCRIRLLGQFALDHYLWVEFLDSYAEPPDLFYGFRVARVRQVRISPRFVERSSTSFVHPAALRPGEYAPNEAREVQAVSEDADGPSFSLLDLTLLPAGTGPVRPSFIGA